MMYHMNFNKHVLTEFIEVYPTYKLYWQTDKIYPSLHSNTSIEWDAKNSKRNLKSLVS